MLFEGDIPAPVEDDLGPGVVGSDGLEGETGDGGVSDDFEDGEEDEGQTDSGSDSDDAPLVTSGANGKGAASETDSDSDDDDAPLVQNKSMIKKKVGDETDSDSDDDDTPLMSKAVAAQKKKQSKKKAAPKAKTPAKAKSKTAASKGKKTPLSSKKGNGGVVKKSEDPHDVLVEHVLRRWWYGIQWPPANFKFEVPSGMEPIPGYSLMYINPESRQVFSVRDQLDPKTPVPSYQWLRKKISKPELRKLANKCIQGQIDELNSLIASGQGDEASLQSIREVCKADLKACSKL